MNKIIFFMIIVLLITASVFAVDLSLLFDVSADFGIIINFVISFVISVITIIFICTIINLKKDIIKSRLQNEDINKIDKLNKQIQSNLSDNNSNDSNEMLNKKENVEKTSSNEKRLATLIVSELKESKNNEQNTNQDSKIISTYADKVRIDNNNRICRCRCFPCICCPCIFPWCNRRTMTIAINSTIDIDVVLRIKEVFEREIEEGIIRILFYNFQINNIPYYIGIFNGKAEYISIPETEDFIPYLESISTTTEISLIYTRTQLTRELINRIKDYISS